MIAIPANRYDLLCMEGFSRALKVFLGLQPAPVYKTIKPASMLRMNVAPSVASIRPFVVCAVLRNVVFDKQRYKNFIDLQEKLHQNICRKRSYVAIGTHDLDTIEGPFRYVALPPNEINFVPLTEDNGRSFSGKELLDFYREDPSAKHLKPYTELIYHSPVYPVIYDAKDRVLSLPPIINSKHSRIQLSTRNVFIECTATDLTKANIVLDTMVAMFSEYCSEPFTAEAVEVHYEADGHQQVTPLLSQRTCDTKISDVNGILGLELSPEEICKLCDRMLLGPAHHIAEEAVIRVNVPPTRSDVLHPVDVVEDVGIAYGFNNLELQIPPTVCIGAPLPINQFSDLLRIEISQAGFMEMLTHGLCSTAENFTHLKRPVGPAVQLSNPANVEYEVVRTTLIPGALKTLAFNESISHKEGVRLFEISDVVLMDDKDDIGARNERHIVALYSSLTSGFEIIHGLTDKIMNAVQIQPEAAYGASSLTREEIEARRRVARPNLCYYVRPCDDPIYFAGMNAEVVLVNSETNEEKVVGNFGVVHPDVLKSFEITYPCSIVELNLELLM